MLNQAIAGHTPSVRISTDHVSVFRIRRCLVNLRILRLKELQSQPYVPMSHSVVKRLIGTSWREHFDHTLFLNSIDRHRKLDPFRFDCSTVRSHRSLDGTMPKNRAGYTSSELSLSRYAWVRDCHGLLEALVAA